MDTKFYFIFLISLIYTHTFAQTVTPYDFSSSTRTYAPLDNAALAVDANEDWEPFYMAYGVESEFAFDLFGLENQGFANFLSPNLLVGGELDYYAYDDIISLIIPHAVQFQNRANIAGNPPSLIRSITEGEVGSRIFKMEFANAGIYLEEDELGTLDMFINVQVWVHETSNCIEFHYGPHSITDETIGLDGEPGYYVAIAATNEIFSDEDPIYSISLEGDPSNPTAEVFENGGQFNEEFYLSSHPADGQVYTFCPEGISVNTRNKMLDLDWTLFPNPASETLTISSQDINEGYFQIMSINGKLISEGKIISNQQNISVQNFTPGHYLTKVTTEEGFSVKRFFKAQ